MLERDKYILWDAGEVIYRAGDPSNEAFLIMEGSVQIFTSEGLLLNRIGVNEILGETSLLLDTTRTVTAIASSVGAKATRIPRQYFADLSAARPRRRGADPQEPVPADRQQQAEQHAWDRNRQDRRSCRTGDWQAGRRHHRCRRAPHNHWPPFASRSCSTGIWRTTRTPWPQQGGCDNAENC